MTGAQFLTYVLAKFKRTDKSTEIYQATTDVIADMRIQFKSEDFKEESYTTAIGTLGDFQVALPSDFGHIIGDVTIIDTNNETWYPPLKKISKARYDELYPERLLATVTNRNLSTPRHYCIFAGQFYLGPVPDHVNYQIQFNYTTEDFTEVDASTDPVPFTDKYRNTLRSGVLMELHNGMENYDEAGYWEEKYTKGLAKIAYNDYSNTQDNASVCYSDY